MVTDIELASVKLVGKFCRRSEGELLRVGDWRMKLYGIACREDLPRESLLASAREIVRDQLSKETVNNYRVGFAAVHDGRDAAFVFVGLLGNADELFHRAFLRRDKIPQTSSAAKQVAA